MNALATPPFIPCSVRLLGAVDPLGDPALARALSEEFLIWDAFVAGQRRVDVHPLVLHPRLHRRAIAAAEGVVAALTEVSGHAHRDAAERARYRLGNTVETLARASFENGDLASLMRVDLLLGADDEVNVCEVNADCPGGHNEAFGLPKLARRAGYFEGHDPTDVVERLCDRLVAASGGHAVGLVYATAYSEDLQVCALLKRSLGTRGVEAILAPPTAPRATADGVFIGAVRVGVLYRFFPTEYMEGQRNLAGLAGAIERGQLRTVSSFAHMFTQSKLAMARAWALRDRLTAGARDAIETHVPESVELTASLRAELIDRRGDWVIKRALGRVGDQVHVGPLVDADAWREVVDDVLVRVGSGESWIAQRFVHQRRIATPAGGRLVTLGAYVLDGQFCGYFARVTRESHVSHDALCLPVFVARDDGREV